MKRHTILLFIGFLLVQTALFSQKEDKLFSKVIYKLNKGVHVLASAKTGQDSLLMLSLLEYDNYGSGLHLMNGNGDILWSKQFFKSETGLMPVDIIPTTDQHFLICLNQTNSNPTKKSILVAKLNQEAETLWVKTFEDDLDLSASDIAESANGDILITGHASISNNETELLLLRINNDGALLWAKTYETETLKDKGVAVAELNTGDLIVGGLAKGEGNYDTEISITKTDANGNLLWAKQKEPSGLYGNSAVNDLVASPDGFYLYGNTVTDGLAISFDEEAEVIWAKSIDQIFLSWNFPGFRQRMTKTFDNDLLLSHGEMSAGGIACRLSGADGAIVWSQAVEMQQKDIQQLSDGGYLFIGLGPLFGVKDLHNPQTGLIRTNTMGEGINCLWDAYLTTQDYTTEFTPLTYNVEDVGTMTDDSLQHINYPLDTLTGCVYFIGAVDETPDAINALTVYPNPGKAPFRLMLEELQPESQAQLSVFDSKGQIIFTKEGRWSELQLFDKQLPAGIYLIQVRAKLGVFAARLVVE